MSKSLSATLAIRLINAKFLDDFGSSDLPQITADFIAQNGTAALQANQLYVGRRTIAGSGTPDVLDLAGGTVYGFGPNGTATQLTMAKVVGVLAINRDAANAITLGGGSNAVLAALPAITPGDAYAQTWRAAAGLPVTAGTGDLLQASVAAGTDVAYDLVILGRSA